MAKPRFAPTGARTTPQFTPLQSSPAPGTVVGARPKFNAQAPSGFQSIGRAPAFTPTQEAELGSFFKATGGAGFGDVIINGGLTDRQRLVAAEIGSRYQRPSTTLGVIARILNVGTNISVGVATSLKDTLLSNPVGGGDDGISWDDLLKISPAYWLPSVIGHNFKEIPTAVWENKTYSDLLEESNDPSSFLYRHSMPIGLAMDIAFDPTTYLTFGATASSKTAARVLLTESYNQSFSKAYEAISIGKYVHANGVEEAVSSGTDVYELAAKIHLIERRPFTPGDAMDALKQTDMARLGEIRQVRSAQKEAAADGVDIAGKVTLRARQKAAFRAAAPRGGFGIRMAGKQLVPPKYTDKLAATVRQVGDAIPGASVKPSTFTSETSPLWSKQAGTTLAELARVPVDTFGKLSEDVLRTMITDTTRQIPRDAAFLTMRQVEEARDLFKDAPPIAGTATDAGVIARATKVMKSIFIEDSPYIPFEYRQNILKPDWKAGGLNPYNKRLKAAQKASFATRAHIIQQAKDMGWPESQVNALSKKWDDLVERYDDPVDVVSRFQIHVGARIYAQNQIDSIFANPMFAAPISEHTDDLNKAVDELDRITERWQTVGDKLRAAKKAKKPKGVITKFQRQFDQAIEEKKAAQIEYDRLFDLQKSELKGKRVVADTGGLARRLGQDAVVETWRGKKYAVPQMVADALEEMRNPMVLDDKLEKALRIMNWSQNKWKILATSVNASFHVMNLIGGMWNNMLGGTNNIFDHMEAYASIQRAKAAESGKATWSGKVLGRFRSLDPNQNPEIDLQRQEFLERSGAGGGMVHFDIHGEGEFGKLATKDAARSGRLVGSKGRKILTASRRAYAGVAIATALAPDEWVPDDVQDALNPGVAAALLLPEAMRAGRHVASNVEDTLRTAPMIAMEKDQSIRQLLHGYSHMPPAQWGKYMGQEVLDLDRHQREVTWAIGARNAINYQFDYTDLKPYERYIAKTIFPFWVFYKNNFILQAREVVNKPRYVNTFFDLSNYMNSLSDNEDNPYFKEMLPEYFDKLNMFRVPVPNFIRSKLGIPKEQDVYLNPKLPFASLNLFPPLWEIFNDQSITPTPQKWAQILSPAFGAVGPMAGGAPFKPLLEYTVGYNLGLARPIDFQRAQSNDYRQSMIEAPGYLTILPGPIRDLFGVYKDPDTGQFKMHSSLKYLTDQMASPFINSAGDAASTFAGEGEASDKQRANTIAWLTGIRLTPVDPLKLQRSWLYRMENYLEGSKADAKFRGVEFPQEDDRLLRQIRAQLKGVERAYDAQQKDIFGGQP